MGSKKGASAGQPNKRKLKQMGVKKGEFMEMEALPARGAIRMGGGKPKKMERVTIREADEDEEGGDGDDDDDFKYDYDGLNDDDGEDGDEPTLSQKKKKQKKQQQESSSKGSRADKFRSHKEELSKLEETDPEFFNFLKKNDTSLLDFDMEDEDDDDDEQEDDGGGDDDEDEEEGDRRGGKKRQAELVPVTSALLDALLKRLSGKEVDGTVPCLKRLLSMLRAACMPSGDAGEDQPRNKYAITSPDMYEKVMVGALESVHKALYRVLGVAGRSADGVRDVGKHPRWKKVQTLVLSFFKSLLHTLSGLAESDDLPRQGRVCVFLLSSLEPYIPLLAPLPRLASTVLKTLLAFWSSGPNPSADKANIRGHAFLRVRQMAMVLPGSIPEDCYRQIYLTYARTCKTFTESNAQAVLFMAQCVAELYRADASLAYQQAFLYIRQLALHLRNATVNKSAENTRQVTSWQFLNCVRLWTRVVCAMPEESALGSLCFPLSQIIHAIMAVSPSLYSIPLHFHLITCLQQLAATCQCFVPTAARLVDILLAPELLTKPTPSTEAPPRMHFLVKFPADSIGRVSVRDAIVNEAITLLRQDAEVYRFHVGLPEYSYLTTRKLRTFVKKNKNAKWRDLARALAGQLEQHAAAAKSGRSKLATRPADVTEFEPLLPVSQPVAADRLKKMLSHSSGMAALQSVAEVDLDKAPVKGVSKEEVTGKSKGNKMVAAKSAKTKKAKQSSADEDDEEGGGKEDRVTSLDWSDSEGDD